MELNRPNLLFSASSEQKENSLVNQIRSRAAKKRGPDGDESSKPESRATTYRTPLTYGDSVATARETKSHSRMDKEARITDPKGILDISISLPFHDLLSPLSTKSVAVSPASTISSNKVVNQDGGENEEFAEDKEMQSQNVTTPVPDVVVPKPILSGSQTVISKQVKQDDDASLLPSSQSSADSCKVSPSHHTTINVDDTAESDAKVVNMATNDTSLDFQGIEDDSSLEQDILTRRRRRRDSTFLRLPMPKERESLSPDPSKSAFVPVERLPV